MPGNPFLRVVQKRIKEKGGWSVVLQRVAQGHALTDIARMFGCSRWTLYKIINRNQKLRKAYQLARREAAMALTEEGMDIADQLASTPGLTREDVAAAKLRVEQRRFMAQAYDRETFGTQATPPTQLNLSIGSLFLEALQSQPTHPSLPVREAEVIEVQHAEALPAGDSRPASPADAGEDASGSASLSEAVAPETEREDSATHEAAISE